MSETSKQVILAIVFSLVSLSTVPSAAQPNPRRRWQNLEREMRSALDKGGFACPDELRFGPRPVETADITGDGILEALVEYSHMGAYTSDFVLMQLEDGEPVTARFRDRHGKKIQVEFLRGASVRNGENAALSPANHAVYGVHWHTDDEGALASCEVDAYVWNPKRGTFDWSAKASGKIALRECVKVRKQVECAAAPCGK